MYNIASRIVTALLFLTAFSCAKDRPYLPGHIRRAFDAVLTTCDPHDLGKVHSCVIFSSAFKEALYVYDATAGETVLGPIRFRPLKVRVGPSTDQLVKVISADKKFPLMLAVDRAQAVYYPVRLFESDDKIEKSFFPPKAKALPNGNLHSLAAVNIDNKIAIVATEPKARRVHVFALNAKNGEIDRGAGKLSIDVGNGMPNEVVINNKIAAISDASSSHMYVLDLRNILSELKTNKQSEVVSIPLGMKSGKLYLSRRNLGKGLQSYAVVFSASGKEVKLVNLDRKQIEAGITLDVSAVAGYFPDVGSDTCCKDIKNWFSAVSVKGQLDYIEIKNLKDRFALKKASTVDLTLESNLSLNKVHIIKILGGTIEIDPEKKRESHCKNNRETFYIANFGNSRAYLHSEPEEVEAHGYSCEGEDTVSRFGFKAH